jgi:hypothetical protein
MSRMKAPKLTVPSAATVKIDSSMATREPFLCSASISSRRLMVLAWPVLQVQPRSPPHVRGGTACGTISSHMFGPMASAALQPSICSALRSSW